MVSSDEIVLSHYRVLMERILLKRFGGEICYVKDKHKGR